MLQQFNEKNNDLKININGELIHRDQAGISPFDSLVQGGDGVWEGLRVYNGSIFKLDEHLERLRRSAKALAFTQIPSRDELVEEIKKTLAANDMNDGVHIRITLSRGTKITSGMDPRLNQAGPTLIVLAEHKPPVYRDAEGSSGLNLCTSSIRRFPPDCMDPNIHHNNLIQSIMAKVEANANGADDALMLDRRGFLAEANATHVFIVSPYPAHSGNNTPVVQTPTTAACPEGITRQTIIDLCDENDIPCIERDLSMTHVYNADECFTTGTMGELAWVGKIDGRVIGDGAMGAMTKRLSELFVELTKREGVRVV
ncbi:MAG: aminotransferase IV [Phycisphaerae bacterium]|nr:aminotransferase IV [Phycisphaerae bacterium]MBM91246.1 aminotransferase IV [Phycisphaerae bacterium]|tara:strand:- start:77 stop:1015 length:939 start_codon:yes stop_codon:yes gene_type:complete